MSYNIYSARNLVGTTISSMVSEVYTSRSGRVNGLTHKVSCTLGGIRLDSSS